MRVLTIMNHKGGCGKTTTAINLSACLAYRGQRVLLVDLDPQQHATMGLRGGHNGKPRRRLHEVFLGAAELSDATVPVGENLDLAPADTALGEALARRREGCLARDVLASALPSVSHRYDFVVLDCPPASGPSDLCALAAADEVIIAVETSFFAMNGVKQLLDLIETCRKEYGWPRSVRAVATMYDRRSNFAREVLREIQSYFREALYNTVISYTVRLKEATSHGLSIAEYDATSRAFADYLAMADEALQSTTHGVGNEMARAPAERRAMYG